MLCSSRMKIYKNQNKGSAINRALNYKVVKFMKHGAHINSTVGSGVFGEISKAYVETIKQIVVVKNVSRGANVIDILAECKKGMVMAGHRNFLCFWLYGT